MRFIYCAILNVLSLALVGQPLTVADFRCEYAISPVGIEIITPGLSSLHYILRLYNGLAGISQDSSSIAYKILLFVRRLLATLIMQKRHSILLMA